MLNSSFHIIFFFSESCTGVLSTSFYPFGKNLSKCGELKLGFVEFLNRDWSNNEIFFVGCFSIFPIT